jgi:trypsin
MSPKELVLSTALVALAATLCEAGPPAAAKPLTGDEPPGDLVRASAVFSDRYIALNAAKESVDRLQVFGTHTLNSAAYVDALHRTSRLNATAIYVGPATQPPSEKEVEKIYPEFKPKPNTWEEDEVYKRNVAALTQEQAAGNRIIGGGQAPADSYKWCVAILDEDHATGCSGTLVASRLVLTARHCAKEMLGGPKKIYVGNIVGDQQGHEYNVKSVFHYPPPIPNSTSQPDIMLLELDSDVPGVDPRAILSSDVQIADAAYVRVIGFGRDQPPNDQGYSQGRAGVKNVADVPLHGGSPTSLGYDPEFEFCAGIRGLNIDSCNGDSGGPALVYIPNLSRSFLYGVVARSVKLQAGDTSRALCGNGGVYTRADKFRDWVQQVAASLGIRLPQ